MERITKTLSLPDWVSEAVQELADKERRSFTGQVEVLLERALNRHEGLERSLPAEPTIPEVTA